MNFNLKGGENMARGHKGLVSGIGTFTHTEGGWTSASARKWLRWWYGEERQLRNVRRAKAKAWQALWRELNFGFLCTLCGHRYEYDGRPFRGIGGWMYSRRCPDCERAGRSASDVDKKFCRYCGTSLTREEFEARSEARADWVRREGGLTNPKKGWGNFACCENCRSFIAELHKLCDEEIELLFSEPASE